MVQHFKSWLSCTNKQQAEFELTSIGYYRSSGDFYSFRQHLTDNTVKQEVNLDHMGMGGLSLRDLDNFFIFQAA